MKRTAAVLPLLALAACTNFRTAHLERDERYALDGIRRLEIVTENGAVEIDQSAGAADELAVHAAIVGAAPTEMGARERADAARLVFAADPAAGRARLEVAFPEGRRSREGCSFKVALPPLAQVIVSTSNGEVRSRATRGELELHTSNGNVTIEDHQGELRIDTSNGAVGLFKVRGAVHASSSNGNIKFTAAEDGLGPVALDTSNGSVEVSLNGNPAGTFELSTSNGEIAIHAPHLASEGGRRSKRVQLSLDGPGGRIETSNGDITVN